MADKNCQSLLLFLHLSILTFKPIFSIHKNNVINVASPVHVVRSIRTLGLLVLLKIRQR